MCATWTDFLSPANEYYPMVSICVKKEKLTRYTEFDEHSKEWIMDYWSDGKYLIYNIGHCTISYLQDFFFFESYFWNAGQDVIKGKVLVQPLMCA
jgi:hypothetical protein